MLEISQFIVESDPSFYFSEIEKYPPPFVGLNMARDCFIYLNVDSVRIVLDKMPVIGRCFAYSFRQFILLNTETTCRRFLKYLE